MDLEVIKGYIIAALAAVIALTCHEFAHGYAAYKLGDNTAKNLGRLTFNPLHHLDIVGCACMVLFGFGWAKPVPINSRNFKKPKAGFAITALAGPLVNLILGFLGAGGYLLFLAAFRGVSFEPGFTFNFLVTLRDFIFTFFSLNIGLALFNLIPIPPLDGSRILNVILPERIYFKIMEYERIIYLVLVIWLLGGDMLCNGIRSIPAVQQIPWLYNAAGFLSLSDILSSAISEVCNLFIKFWTLIPYLRG